MLDPLHAWQALCLLTMITIIVANHLHERKNR